MQLPDPTDEELALSITCHSPPPNHELSQTDAKHREGGFGVLKYRKGTES